ncbi:MAG: tetratricopeptide repeat protein [Chthoniobacterales bacterium]
MKSTEREPENRVWGNKFQVGVTIALFVLTVMLYASVRHFGFVNFDDDDYVVANPHVLGGLTVRDIGWAFTHFHAGNWHPLTWISHMVDVQVWGLNSGGHHLTNVILHATNAALLFAILARMTGAPWKSAFVAAIFAWHPLHVESVAWISERKDVLSGFFWILTLGAYHRYVGAPGPRNYALVLILFAAGLMSKPMVVTLPFVLLLLDYWPLQRAGLARTDASRWRQLFVEKLPFFALALISSVITIAAQHSFGAVKSIEEVPAMLRLGNIPVSYVRYLANAVWPSDLSVFYPLAPHIPKAQAASSLALLFLITTFAVAAARRIPSVCVGWFLFLGTLLPVIGIVQVGIQALADRYMYLPLIGPAIIVAWGAPRLVGEGRFRRPALAFAGVILLAGCAVATARQTLYWRDSVSLYEHAFRVASQRGTTHMMLFDGLADALLRDGRAAEADEIVTKARQQFPENAKRLNLAGLIKLRLGYAAEAESLWNRALQLDPTWYQIYNNLGILHTNTQRWELARRDFERLVELRPDDALALGNLSQLCLATKDYDAARRYCALAITAAPSDPMLRALEEQIEHHR